MRLNLKRKVRRRLHTREHQPPLASAEFNRIWALDFMRGTQYYGRPFRTLSVIGEGNRVALRIECGTPTVVFALGGHEAGLASFDI